MAGHNDQGSTSLDALLAKMPQIAEAVSRFPEAVQQQAFDVLIAEATQGSTGARGAGSSATEQGEARRRTRSKGTKANGDAEPTKRRRAGSPSEVRDLDLAPKGKTSFKDFVQERKPKNQDDMNAVSVYYLLDMIKVNPVTADHVYTCYREAKVRVPTNLPNSLALTASRKGFLDTANLDDLGITPRGRNYVEHDLPPKTKEK